MAHGDNRGLKLPPKVAPIQAVIVPIAMKKEGVIEKVNEIGVTYMFILKTVIPRMLTVTGIKTEEQSSNDCAENIPLFLIAFFIKINKSTKNNP